MSSRKEKHIIRDFDKKIDKRKAGAKRRADSKKRKPSMVYRYCKSIINFGIKAQYALMDTWFYSDKLTSDLQEIGLHSICMIKKNLKFSFVCKTTRYNSNKLLSALKKRQNLDSDIISATEAQTPSGQIFRDSCDEMRTIPFLEALETLSCCFTSLIDELHKAGCIADDKLQLAYNIAKDVINKWYCATSKFIQSLLSPEFRTQFLNS